MQTPLTIQNVVEAGVAPASASGDTGNGNSFQNPNGDVFALIENTHASAAETFTFTAQNTSFSDAKHGTTTAASVAIALAALSKQLVGPFPPAVFNDGNGNVNVAFSGSGTPKISVFKLSGAKII